ncbi:hypothetical protein RHSIM_Rhsim10G0117800 [Rhododendron simsii]|uniref:Uncharacterized protein n=1 Tax=Rhododendron simsii TaxID=118357 RepID=A0A834GC06_RHOSS|nr:hypothetical protein RHSIM_Rhsim10G0117800 [Rhododendron simsii]
MNFKLLNLLVKPLIEMSGGIPYFDAICARQRLLWTRTQFCEDVKNPEKLLAVSENIISRLWSMIFPCFDFRHAVMTPAVLLMCEYLMWCPIMSGRDIALGSFLYSKILSVTKQSRKFCSEAITFIHTLLMAAMYSKPGRILDSQWHHFMEVKTPGTLLCIHACVKEISPLDFFKLMDMPEDSPFFSPDNFSYNEKTVMEKILKKSKLENYQLGKTKVFLRAGQIGVLDSRAEVLDNAAKCIQGRPRTFVARRDFVSTRVAVVSLQACCRGFLLFFSSHLKSCNFVIALEKKNSILERELVKAKEYTNDTMKKLWEVEKTCSQLQQKLQRCSVTA